MSSVSGEATLQATHGDDADWALLAVACVAAMACQGIVLLVYRPWMYVGMAGRIARMHAASCRLTSSQQPLLLQVFPQALATLLHDNMQLA